MSSNRSGVSAWMLRSCSRPDGTSPIELRDQRPHEVSPGCGEPPGLGQRPGGTQHLAEPVRPLQLRMISYGSVRHPAAPPPEVGHPGEGVAAVQCPADRSRIVPRRGVVQLNRGKHVVAVLERGTGVRRRVLPPGDVHDGSQQERRPRHGRRRPGGGGRRRHARPAVPGPRVRPGPGQPGHPQPATGRPRHRRHRTAQGPQARRPTGDPRLPGHRRLRRRPTPRRRRGRAPPRSSEIAPIKGRSLRPAPVAVEEGDVSPACVGGESCAWAEWPARSGLPGGS